MKWWAYFSLLFGGILIGYLIRFWAVCAICLDEDKDEIRADLDKAESKPWLKTIIENEKIINDWRRKQVQPAPAPPSAPND